MVANMKDIKITPKEALEYHMRNNEPGKVALAATKPMLTQQDLSLAYSPGVAVPCEEIYADKRNAFKYTSKGNYVAVITNGTAILGLGNLGALASKPVMEGKCVLFKRFADIDATDILVDTEDIDEFVNCVRFLGETWGGINLEDIKSPDCFVIEKRLQEVMNLPVFHDDQHGTAIVIAAALLNAAEITGKDFGTMRVVLNGPGAAGLACVNLIKSMGCKNVIICDKLGVVYEGREQDMNKWKAGHAIDTDKRSLADALEGADVFLGLSVKDALSVDMIKGMKDKPIIFAMANPDPEIDPKLARDARPDAIIATGRSDYPNQINNVMGFPYIFRGTLDVRASRINQEMKIAAVHALADLAKLQVPDEVTIAYSGRKMTFGPNYIIPTPFDPRLLTTIAPAVAQAAIDTGVAQEHMIVDIEEYRNDLLSRLNPINNTLGHLFDNLKNDNKKIIFAEGEEEKIIQAAITWRDNEYGSSILIGKEEKIREKAREINPDEDLHDIEIMNAALVGKEKLDSFVDLLYKRQQRKGMLLRDCIREVKTDRNIFASCMLELDMGDVMVTGLTRSYNVSLNKIKMVAKEKDSNVMFAFSMIVSKEKTIFLADTAINERPSAEQLADISIKMAKKSMKMGFTPYVAFVSHATFGNPETMSSKIIRETLSILDKKGVDFEYDGEMSVDVALNKELRKSYQFCRLTKPANILITPGLHSANIAFKLLHEMSNVNVIGPILTGFEKHIQILPINSSVNEILNSTICVISD